MQTTAYRLQVAAARLMNTDVPAPRFSAALAKNRRRDGRCWGRDVTAEAHSLAALFCIFIIFITFSFQIHVCNLRSLLKKIKSFSHYLHKKWYALYNATFIFNMFIVIFLVSYISLSKMSNKLRSFYTSTIGLISITFFTMLQNEVHLHKTASKYCSTGISFHKSNIKEHITRNTCCFNLHYVVN